MPHSLPAQTVRSFRAAHISTAVTRTGTAKLAGAELVGVIQHCPSFLRSDTVDCRVGLLPLDEAPSAQLPVAPVAIAVCCLLAVNNSSEQCLSARVKTNNAWMLNQVSVRCILGLLED
ncbi:hypothetical protein WJX77_008405 [Trebouxia sp. C0004]